MPVTQETDNLRNFQPTPQLRYLKRTYKHWLFPDTIKTTLQQRWVCSFTGESEWRYLPMEEVTVK